MEDMKSKDLPNNVAECRYSYIKWLAHFMINRKQEDETRYYILTAVMHIGNNVLRI